MKDIKEIENELPIENTLCVWYNHTGTSIKNLVLGYMLHSNNLKKTVIICHRTGEVLDIEYFTHYAEILTPKGGFIWSNKSKGL